MRAIISLILVTIITITVPFKCLKAQNQEKEKLRVMMTTDFPPIGVVKSGDNVTNTMKSDPDDMQSMVRFLLYANEFDIEGLIASACTFAMEAHKQNIMGVLDRYEMVYENLKTHDPDYPTANYLRSVTYEGLGNNHGISIKWGHNKQPYTDIIGEGMDSEASIAIIAAADKPDPRPIYIGVWGGPREVAQAIWKVKNTRSQEELDVFINKLRIYLITYQNATHDWLIDEFPDLFIIESIKTYGGIMRGKDPISDLAWVNENIRFNHGPLCEVYPHEGMVTPRCVKEIRHRFCGWSVRTEGLTIPKIPLCLVGVVNMYASPIPIIMLMGQVAQASPDGTRITRRSLKKELTGVLIRKSN